MEIKILRNSTVYSDRATALQKLGTLEFEYGELVCSSYLEADSVKVIFALGLDGVGQYKLISTYSDLTEAISTLQTHLETLATGTTPGLVKNSDSSPITFTNGVASFKSSQVIPGNPTTGNTIALDGALDVDNSKVIANVDYVRRKIDEMIEAANAMTYKGSFNPSTSTLPKAMAGDLYVISSTVTAATDKTGLGVMHVGDQIICKLDNTAAGTSTAWDKIETHSESVFGPGSSVSGNIMTFSGTSGKVASDSGVNITNVVQNTRKVKPGTDMTGGGALSGDVTITHANVTRTDSGSGAFVSAVTTSATGHVTGITKASLTLTAGTGVETNGQAKTNKYISGVSVSGSAVVPVATDFPGTIKVNSQSTGYDYLANQVISKTSNLADDEYSVSFEVGSTGKLESSVTITRIDGGTY